METAIRYGAVLKRAGREHVGPCPFCGGKDRFSINPARHLWHCRGHGGGYDAAGLVMHIASMSFLQAVEDITGEPPPDGTAVKPLSEAEKAERERRRTKAEVDRKYRESETKLYQENTRKGAAAIWAGSGPVKGTLAEAYLSSRGLRMDEYPDVLRYHPALPYPKGKKYPALICRVDDLAGDLTAVWRIYLRADGRKADVENAKLGLGPAGGGAVRLGGAAERIGIAEGVESAMSAWLLTGQKTPVWAALSTAGLVAVEMPLIVERLTIYPDGDPPLKKQGNEYVQAEPAGRKAAEALRARLLNEGIGVTIAPYPAPGKDYNDLWLGMDEPI